MSTLEKSARPPQDQSVSVVSTWETGFEFRVPGSGFRVPGFGCRGWGLGVRG